MIKIIKSSNVQELLNLRKKLSITDGLVTKRSLELTRKVFHKPLKPVEVVRTIISDVQKNGDRALLKYNKKIDGLNIPLKNLIVKNKEIQKAYKKVDPHFVKSIKKAYKNIKTYQDKIKYSFKDSVKSEGLNIKLKVSPLERIGIYIPGGTALYPSSILMTAVPACSAGVSHISMITPPLKNGMIDEHILVTADICGVHTIYKAGGVQAVAALALGTETIKKVDKIAGPGNIYIALAKKELYGHIDIDMVAGPSEIIILADETARADFIALDMMAQAEHYPGSALLITPSSSLAKEVNKEIIKNIDQLSRKNEIKESLRKYSLIVQVKNIKEGIKLTNDFAPEHLEIITKDMNSIVSRIKHAGAVFLGNYTPVALGDYFAGPSHTLPTGGTARFFSGVNVNDFLKTTAVISSTQKYLKRNAQYINSIADKEGLTAHKKSIEFRKKNSS